MVDTSSAPLPTPEPNRRKVFFLGGIAAIFIIFVLLLVVFMKAGKTSAGKDFDPDTKAVVVWTYGIPTTVFEGVSKGFNDFLGRTDIKIQVKNFGSYTDMLDVLPTVTHDGNAPDVVLVPNHGGYRIIDSYISSLGENIIDFTDFEDRFHPLFTEELIYEEKSQDQIVRGLRGIPFGFEPLGIYFNRELLPQAPTSWAEISAGLTEQAKTENVSPLSLGYGRATPHTGDIVAYMTMQARGPQINSYATIDAVETRGLIDDLLDYRRSPNNLDQYSALYADTLTMTDLFARGKVATLVGYPSTERDIDMAMKRAKKDNALDPDLDDNIAWTTIPQTEKDPKKQTNFARYGYFAMTKDGVNRNKTSPANDPVIKFMQYLVTAEAQEVLSANIEYLLPSQQSLLASNSKKRIDGKTGTFGMTVGDWYVPTQKYLLYDKGIPALYDHWYDVAFDEPGATASAITSNVQSRLTCKLDHLTDPNTYSEPCDCVTSIQSNNNHYWPVCGE